MLPPLRTLLEVARERSTLVVHAVERHRPAWRTSSTASSRGTGTDEESAYVDGFAPSGSPQEIELPKRRYSAFYATDLDLLLREQGIERLVVAGVKTNVCVRATIEDAFAGGYEVLLARDATNSNRPHLAAASLEDIDRYFGRVVDLSKALEAL